MNTPLVSICCITYNHAQFIQKCLDGFLMQQTDFPIEILIHDDCSTDGTTEIIREYEAKYPDLIFPLYEEENQYQQGKAAEIDFYNYRRARGKYIAYCEGDDYWIDPLKLQKQVDFMEANPEYSVCFHDFQVYDVRRGKLYNMQYKNPQLMTDNGVDVTNDTFFHMSYGGQPLTMMFRLSMFDFRWQTMYSNYKDNYEIYHLLRAGKGRYIDFVGGVYVRHEGGICTSSSTKDACYSVLECVSSLYNHNKDDKFIKDYLCEVIVWSHDVLSKNEFYKFYIRLLPKATFELLKALYIIFKRKFKSILK